MTLTLTYDLINITRLKIQWLYKEKSEEVNNEIQALEKKLNYLFKYNLSGTLDNTEIEQLQHIDTLFETHAKDSNLYSWIYNDFLAMSNIKDIRVSSNINNMCYLHGKDDIIKAWHHDIIKNTEQYYAFPLKGTPVSLMITRAHYHYVQNFSRYQEHNLIVNSPAIMALFNTSNNMEYIFVHKDGLHDFIK